MNPPLPTANTPNNQQIINKIDDFISGLNAPPGTTIATSVVTKTTGLSGANGDKRDIIVEAPKTDEELKTFVLQHSAELVESSINSIVELQKLVIATGDAEMMGGLASLIAASTGAIETVNKIQIQNQRAESARELKKLDIEGKREVQRLKNEGYLNLPAGQTNILVATREEIMEQLTGKVKTKTQNEVFELNTTTLSSAPLT